MLNLKDVKTRSAPVVALLDVGTSKICCVIATIETAAAVQTPTARLASDAQGPARPLNQRRGIKVPRVLGIGLQRARGVKAGVVIDPEAAERAIRAAVCEAEKMAGVQLQDVYLGVACGRLRSHNFAASSEVHGAVVRDDDVEQVMRGGRAYAERDGRKLVHMNAISYRLDDHAGIHDPRGLAGRKLTMDLHAVTADEAPLSNLMRVVERCHLSVAGIVAAPYASAIAATTPEERQMGVVCLDMGAGKTSFSIFADGHFLYTDAIAIGADHISFDISRGLSTPLPEAERIKTLYGTMVNAASDSHEVISFPMVGDDAAGGGQMLYQTTRAHLHQFVQPRAENILSLVLERIERSRLSAHADRRVVLTGGGAALAGLAEFTAAKWGRSVRVSQPEMAAGVPSSVCRPAFSTVMGLLFAAMDPTSGVMALQNNGNSGAGYMGKVEKWLRESF